ncbi:MAG: hypothetical protein MJ196_11600 [Treponemataceae bacterium]|nr:hypothetical protein [Treponemataceae bacterium]
MNIRLKRYRRQYLLFSVVFYAPVMIAKPGDTNKKGIIAFAIMPFLFGLTAFIILLAHFEH